jgi:hypothetical protein
VDADAELMWPPACPNLGVAIRRAAFGFAVRRGPCWWAPFALTEFRERLARTDAKLAVSLQRCADLGASLDLFEARRRP